MYKLNRFRSPRSRGASWYAIIKYSVGSFSKRVLEASLVRTGGLKAASNLRTRNSPTNPQTNQGSNTVFCNPRGWHRLQRLFIRRYGVGQWGSCLLNFNGRLSRSPDGPVVSRANSLPNLSDGRQL